MDLVDFLSRADDWRVEGRFPRATEITFKPSSTVRVAYQRATSQGLLYRQSHGQYELTPEGKKEVRRWRTRLNKK